jgi:nucleotide-binding universal stress UspA family protein
MKNILVPIDFSEVSKNALKFAVKLAHALEGKIVLYHTEQPVLIASDMGGFVYPDMELETEKMLHQKLDELVESIQHQNVEAIKILQRGILKDSIETIIERAGIDLIVTGTHGAKGLESFFFGTNSVDIFEHVKCPVLIVPANAHYHSIRKIMYATDLQYGDIHEIEKVAKVAKPFSAEIIVTHVNNDPQKIAEEKENMDWFEEIADKHISYKNIIYRFIYHNDVQEALENAITVLNIDVICMSVTEKAFFKKLFSKSNTKEMAFHTNIPLMVLHLGEENKLK